MAPVCPGKDTPSCLYAHCTNPEQSNCPVSGLRAPKRYVEFPINCFPASIAELPPPVYTTDLLPESDFLLLVLSSEELLDSEEVLATSGVAGVSVSSVAAAISALISSSNDANSLSSDSKLAFFSLRSASFDLSDFFLSSTSSICVSVTYSTSFKSSCTSSFSSNFSSINYISFCFSFIISFTYSSSFTSSCTSSCSSTFSSTNSISFCCSSIKS